MRLVGAACAGLLILGACAPDPDEPPTEAPGSSDEPTTQPSASASGGRASTKPLHDRRIVIDPGHQLGNANFPDRVNRQVPAGGFEKPCNSTGTATNGGYPESTLTWRVSTIVARELRALGADVRLTRHSNRDDRWGPCVNVRGRAGNRWDADAKVSIHADGSLSGGRGFHVIAPVGDNRWTGDIHRPSKRLAEAMRRGLRGGDFAVSDYAGENGIDFRDDLGTLNLSDVPTVMVELGNMRSDHDASIMTSAKGRNRYARVLVSGVRTYLHRN